jgi:hypothetical protein
MPPQASQVQQQPPMPAPQPVPVPNQQESVVSLKNFSQPFTSDAPQESNSGSFRVEKESSTLNSPQEEVIYSNQIPANNPVAQSQPQQSTQMPVQVQQQILDFKQLPFSTSTYEPGFINMPNTINGEIIDSNGSPLSGVLINIEDNAGNILRTVASGGDGKFYSYSSFPFGQYIIEVQKEGHSFGRFTVNMDGGTIFPKVIQSLR